MKWDKPNGSTQGTSDGRYVIVNASSQQWIAYELTPYGTGAELGVKPTDVQARECCESHEAQLIAEHRRSA